MSLFIKIIIHNNFNFENKYNIKGLRLIFKVKEFLMNHRCLLKYLTLIKFLKQRFFLIPFSYKSHT